MRSNAVQEARRQRSDVVQGREVGALGLGRGAGATLIEPFGDAPQPPLVAPDGHDGRATPRQLDGRRLADPGARAGDHDHPAGKLGCVVSYSS